jgi:regulator of sigma E protease
MDLFANMPTGVAAIFWGVLTFSLLIVLHEGGHFLAARAFGVKVHEFMLGLPGPALKWRSKKSGVTYGITAVPLGGYVRIAGMEPGPEDVLLAAALGALTDAGRLSTGDLATKLGVDRDRAASLMTTLEDYIVAERMDDWPEDRALAERREGETDEEMLARVRASVYRGQPAWKRVTILAMGVLVNLATAVLVFTIVLTTVGHYVYSETNVVGSVQKDSPAAVAGLKPGDTVVAIDGARIARWQQLPDAVRAHRPGETVRISLLRGGAERTVAAKLATREDSAAVAFLGVGPLQTQVRVPLGPAIGESFSYIGLTFVAIADFFNPSKFTASVGQARSVVGISYEVARAAQDGPLQYAAMVALLSLSLGVMNILPIPPLDGGKVAVEIVEALIRRPIPKKLSYALSGLGAVLLFSLIFYLMYADVMRYIVKVG